MLDNVDHIKAYWISCGVEVAQTALWFGADDLDGTVQEETIYHMAGSSTPTALSTGDIEQLIRDAGREPIERDTLYNVVRVPVRIWLSAPMFDIAVAFRLARHLTTAVCC